MSKEIDFLEFLNTYEHAIDEFKEKLKEILITYFIEVGDDETAQTIINKGMPYALHVYGEKTTCIKSPFFFVQTSPIAPKGTMIAVYNELPKLAKGGTICKTKSN